MMKQIIARTLALGALAALAACAPAATTAGGQNPNLLTRDDIMAVEVTNLYDVVQRLRPRWLTVRAGRSLSELRTEVVVFQNQTLLGGIDVLRQMQPDIAVRIRYLDGSTASATLPGLGSRHVEGAIVIETTGN
jgi:hypothetical protein